MFDPEQTKAYIAHLKDKDTRAGKVPPKFVPAQPKSSSRTREKKVNQNPLMALFNGLEPEAKSIINQQFLQNIKSGKNHQSFQQSLQKYVDRSQEREKTKQALNNIFPQNRFKSKNAAQ